MVSLLYTLANTELIANIVSQYRMNRRKADFQFMYKYLEDDL